ncbi:ExeA family protein [Adhaeretor mobilis]|uniref:ATPase family associated with various cellular activities (AAA) n=1 Tax=Adhaeretor mobilis TaxID=1930276 RepID=A0A517N0N9_9BACT|nr:AAA family ATPase [Adhaeretor mobilis]QDT00697.1 ATPase family associated with various cellular activities (AAA) [Adhaeretor mobilis]
MYQDYWQLAAKPFEPRCDEGFFFSCASHQAVLHKLRYALESRRAAALLAGPTGVGKTQLIAELRRQAGEAYRPFVEVVFPQMTERDLLVYLAEQLGAPPASDPRYTVEESLRRLNYVLNTNAQQERHAVVVIDEAHLLEDTGLLEPLRLLLNLNDAGQPLFTLLLVGQPALLPAIARFGALEERLDAKATLEPLDSEETCQYIEQRLQAAGASREIFAVDALLAAHQLTGGVPRRINRLCDLALLVGFANERPTIDAETLQAVRDELVGTTPLAA